MVHVLDLGLAKYYRDTITQNHIDYKNGVGMTGTPRYCSINAHKGHEQSRRDDLESLGYMLIYFMKGSLPWQGIKSRSKDDKNLKICNAKEKSTSDGSLFEGLPIQFKDYFDVVLKLVIIPVQMIFGNV